jgi:hypothetical protein
MKNEKAVGEFRRYDSDFGISTTINQLREAIHNKKDPVETLRTITDIDDIAAVLKCGSRVYEDHLKHLEARTPYSPLTGHHVLNLCKKTGVHPADMASLFFDSQDACQPHIFAALLILSRGGAKVHLYDRTLADAALITEKKRYNNFIIQNPIFSELFNEIIKAAREHFEWPVVDIRNKDLKSILEKAVNPKLNGHSPETHIENYHTILSSRISELDKTIFHRLIHDPRETADVRLMVASFYGEKKADEIYSALMKRAADPGRDELSDKDAIADLQNHLPASEADTRLLCRKIYALSKRLEKTRNLHTLSNQNMGSLKLLDVISAPELHYVQYLYCNHVNANPISVENNFPPPSREP